MISQRTICTLDAYNTVMLDNSPKTGAEEAELVRLVDLVGREQVATITRQYETAWADMRATEGFEYLPEHPDPSYVLSVHASDCEVAGDWVRAEAAYRAILDWPDASPMDVHKGHYELSRLCEMRGRPSEALAHAREATRTCRLTNLDIMLAVCLATEAQELLHAGLVEPANDCIDEIFSLLPVDPLWDHLRARAHVLQAKCALRRRNLEKSEADVQRAMALMEPWTSWTDAAGFQSTIASCWSVKADLLHARNDCHGAVAAWQEAVRVTRLTATEPRLAGVYAFYRLATMLQGLAAALVAAGHRDESRKAEEEQIAIRARLRLLSA